MLIVGFFYCNIKFQLLLGTGQFVSHEDDLLSWLNILKSSDSEALDFVCTVMMTYIHNPFPYMDRMSDLDIDVTMETEKPNKKEYSINGTYFNQYPFQFRILYYFQY